MTGTHQDAKRISAELGEWETLVTAPRCTARKRESVTTSAQSGKLRQQTITSSLPLSSTAPKHAHPPNCSPLPAHRRSKHCTTEREDEAPGPNKNTKRQLARDAYLKVATWRHGHARRPTHQTRRSVESRRESGDQHTCFNHTHSATPN